MNELNDELSRMKKQCEELDNEKHYLRSELEKQCAIADANSTKQTIGSLMYC